MAAGPICGKLSHSLSTGETLAFFTDGFCAGLFVLTVGNIIVRPDIMQDKMPSETMTRFQTALLRFCSASLPNSVKVPRTAPEFPPVRGGKRQRAAVLSVRGDVQPFDFAGADGIIKRREPAFFPLL